MVTIEVDEDVWKTLMLQKEPGDSFNDVLRRELKIESVHTESKREHDRESVDEPIRRETYRAVLERWQPGRDQQEREAIRAHGIEAAEWLRDQDVAKSKSQFIDALYHEEIDAKADSWWRKRARAGLQQLRDEGMVEKDGRKWRWVG